MIFVGYLALLVAIGWRLIAGAQQSPQSVRTVEIIRTVAFSVAVVTVIAAGLGIALADMPPVGVAIAVTAGSGGLAHAAGVALWRGRIALALRWLGWVGMSAALAVPSTLTICLLATSLLVTTLRRFPAWTDAGHRHSGGANAVSGL